MFYAVSVYIKSVGWGDVRCRCKMGLLKVDLNFEQHVFYAVSVYIKSVGWGDVRCRWACLKLRKQRKV